MSAVVQIKGVEGIRRALKPLLQPELDKQLDASTKKAAQLYARELRTAVRPLSKRMARAVRVRRARRDKPGWVVGSRRKVAFFWPFVIGGTRTHGPRRAPALVFKTKDGRTVRTQRVRGVRPHPVVEQVAKRAETRAFNEVDKSVKT